MCSPFCSKIWDHLLRQWERTVSYYVPSFKACHMLVSGRGLMYVERWFQWCICSHRTPTSHCRPLSQIMLTVPQNHLSTDNGQMYVNTAPNDLILARARKLSKQQENQPLRPDHDRMSRSNAEMCQLWLFLALPKTQLWRKQGGHRQSWSQHFGGCSGNHADVIVQLFLSP